MPKLGNPKERLKKLRLLKILKAKEDPYFFLTKMCYTFDEHDKENPYKLIPEKAHIENLCRAFREEDKIMIEKSRQMTFSWSINCLILWDVVFGESRHWYVVSKKEADADELLNRMDFTYRRLPEELRDPGYKKIYCQMHMPKNMGRVTAQSQNPEDLRSKVASGVFVDESEFLDYFKETYEAVKPTTDGGGKLITVSTVNGKGPVYKIMNDMMDF